MFTTEHIFFTCLNSASRMTPYITLFEQGDLMLLLQRTYGIGAGEGRVGRGISRENITIRFLDVYTTVEKQLWRDRGHVPNHCLDALTADLNMEKHVNTNVNRSFISPTSSSSGGP